MNKQIPPFETIELQTVKRTLEIILKDVKSYHPQDKPMANDAVERLLSDNKSFGGGLLMKQEKRNLKDIGTYLGNLKQ